MSNNHFFGIRGKGWYIALILCAAAIGITGYVYQKSENDLQEATLQETEIITVTVPRDVPVLATEPAPTVPPATVPRPTQPPQPKALVTASPLEGNEVCAYSVDALCYNATTRDWRIHSGVDIAAAEGTRVCAAAEGTVAAAYEDDAMGYTVVLNHQDGYSTSYACLSEDLAVQVGDRVSLGQCLGYVGSSALLESAVGSHVHFSVSCDQTPMDPADFLKLG